MASLRHLRGVVAVATLALAATACSSSSTPSGQPGSTSGGGSTGGSSSSSSSSTSSSAAGGGGGGTGQTVIWGTTDTPVSFDPAGSYDLPSWNVVYNVYQTLLRVDPSTEKLVPDAASACNPNGDYTVWTCTLKPGQKFSNGDAVDANAVKYSFDRVIGIKSPSGPASLLGDVSTKAVGTDSVVFTLKSGNALWPQILSTAAGAIVDPKVFAADKVLDSSQVVGSGPYMLKTYQEGQLAQFVPNPNYGGDLKLANNGMVIQYYKDANTLKLDIQQGKVDVAYRNLTPTQLDDLKNSSGLTEVSGPGGEIRYLVFNLAQMPGSSDAQKLAIRQAAAYLIDRNSIATNVYHGTVEPLYSMVPQGLDGYEPVYQTTYGSAPDKAKAQQALSSAGVSTPVKITVYWTPSHYGPLSSDEYTEIKRELEGSGLFSVNLQSTEWQQYTGDCLADKCPAYQMGWFPDYPDTDDYVGEFYGKNSFLNDHYDNPQIDQLIADEQASTDAAKRTADFKQIQELAVKDTPTIPIWQGKQIAVAGKGVSGLQDTLTPDYIFRFWLVGKS